VYCISVCVCLLGNISAPSEMYAAVSAHKPNSKFKNDNCSQIIGDDVTTDEQRGTYKQPGDLVFTGEWYGKKDNTKDIRSEDTELDSVTSTVPLKAAVDDAWAQ